MSRLRRIVMILLLLKAAVLIGWQTYRERLVTDCLESGGAWTGSDCGPPRVRPILQRDLQRS